MQAPCGAHDLLAELSTLFPGAKVVPGSARRDVPVLWNHHLLDSGRRSQDSGSGSSTGPPPPYAASVPLAYVECTAADNVVAAVRFACRHGLKISARGNGHHYGGACLVEGGLVLDLSHMQAIHVDPVKRTATLQPGVTTAQLSAATIAHGLHFPGGHISTVGISGFILGGGNGWGVRHCGAACDNVLEFEVVLPSSCAAAAGAVTTAGYSCAEAAGDGPAAAAGGDVGVQRVSAESDPELFWGLKGAGLFLGIVTEFVVRLHPVPDRLPCVTAIYPLAMAQEAATLVQALHSSGPVELETSLALTHIPLPPADASASASFMPSPHHPGMQAVAIVGCVAFLPASGAALEAALDQVRGFAPDKRLFLQDESLPYLEALATLDAAWEWPGLCLYSHGTLVKEERFDAGLVEVLQRHMSNASSPRSLLLVAPAAPAGHAPCAYGFRGSFYLGHYAMWPRDKGPATDGDAKHADWVRATAAETAPWVSAGYLNEVMLDRPGQARGCFEPGALVRLLALKARYDPQGLLRQL